MPTKSGTYTITITCKGVMSPNSPYSVNIKDIQNVTDFTNKPLASVSSPNRLTQSADSVPPTSPEKSITPSQTVVSKNTFYLLL